MKFSYTTYPATQLSADTTNTSFITLTYHRGPPEQGPLLKKHNQLYISPVSEDSYQTITADTSYAEQSTYPT